MPRSALFFLLACTLLTGCTITGQVEQWIARELPDAIGPADAYTVQIEGLRARAGAADRVLVTGTRVRPEGAPVLDRLDLELRGVQYDRRAERLDRAESAVATARLLPADLNVFLEQNRNVREAMLTLRAPDEATLRVRPSIGGFSVPAGVAVELTGRLVSTGGQVAFEVATLRAAGLNLGSGAAQRLSDAINPLVDLTDAPADLRVTSLRVENGALLVEATGDPSGLRLH